MFVRILCALALLWLPIGADAQKSAATWDGLERVKSKRLDAVFLRPQADFRTYSKVLISPTEVAFRKNRQRTEANEIGGRVSYAQARRILDEAQDMFQDALRRAYQKAGYEIVGAAGADVLRVATGVVDLDIEAPDAMSAGITRTYTREAGSATLVVEARDSLSGQLLGRAADARSTGDFGPYLRNRATNAGEFDQLFRTWADASAKGLTELKALSPIDPATAGRKR